MMANPADTTTRRFDFGFAVIVVIVLINVVWLLLTPLVDTVAMTTMKRFHLATNSYWGWAIQQPIPSMYNFGNRWKLEEIPPDFGGNLLLNPLQQPVEKRYINHFPTRILTFANTRWRYFHEREDRWLTIETSYRGQSIQSRFHAKFNESGELEMVRLAETNRP